MYFIVQLANVQSAANLSSVHSALKQGNAALKELQEQVSLEDVEQLMQDTEESAQYQQKLQHMLGMPFKMLF
jgi:charged multivesicular body protein 6